MAIVQIIIVIMIMIIVIIIIIITIVDTKPHTLDYLTRNKVLAAFSSVGLR